MSLLDNGPHIVSVQNRVRIDTPHGSTFQNDGEPVDVRGALQPLSAAESSLFDGTVTFTQKRFLSRAWPGNANSVVTAADGVYDCVGDPQHYNMSGGTAHWEIVLRRRNAVG